MIRTWSCPLPDGTISEELVVSHGAGGETRILVVPPLFDEHNKLRRQLVDVMRRFADAEVMTFLPDLPGWNESTAALDQQTLAYWRLAMAAAAQHFDVSHVLAVRSGALLAPEKVTGWLYAPQSGKKLLRAMVRARIISSNEAGHTETSEQIHQTGRDQGLTLAGWHIGAEMFRELESAELPQIDKHRTIDQSCIGGEPLWLRAEPDHDAAQATALANMILESLGKPT